MSASAAYLVVGPRLVAEHELLDLAGGGLRQLPEGDRLRGFEPGQPGPDVLDDLLLGRRSRRPAASRTRPGTSPQRSSGTAITAASSTAGMVHDRLLDLDRGDVLAAGDDHVLAAVTQLDVPVGMQDADVAGAEPAVGRRFLRSPRGSSR